MKTGLKKVREALFKDKKTILLAVLGAAAVLLLLVSEILPDKTSETNISRDGIITDRAEYIKETENRLRGILESIDGAGEVRVMITVESLYENVYATERQYSEQSDEKSKALSGTDEVVVLDNSGEGCALVKVYEPKVSGVAVTAVGAYDPAVRRAISDTVTSVFGIASTCVSVEIMNKKTLEETE